MNIDIVGYRYRDVVKFRDMFGVDGERIPEVLRPRVSMDFARPMWHRGVHRRPIRWRWIRIALLVWAVVVAILSAHVRAELGL